MSAKRARLSGEFQSRAGYPKNGPAAGSGYVLRSQRKVKARKRTTEPKYRKRMQQKTGVS
jgi:hypothetical protein